MCFDMNLFIDHDEVFKLCSAVLCLQLQKSMFCVPQAGMQNESGSPHVEMWLMSLSTKTTIHNMMLWTSGGCNVVEK